jgi:arsenical pump membrane protein
MLALLPVEAADLLRPAVEVLWRPLLTITSLMVLTLLAERAGLFERLLGAVVAIAGGSGRRLFLWLFLAGLATGMLFTNDAAVLILTPLVCVMSRDLVGLRPRPYLFAILNVANLVAAFVISNPINIVVANYFDLNFLDYARWMFLPALVAAAGTYGMLRWLFRDEIAQSDFTVRAAPAAPPPAPAFARLCGIVILAVLAGAFLSPLVGVRLWMVTVTGALLLLALGRQVAGIAPVAILRLVAWDVLVFVIGFFIIVSGLREAGLSVLIGQLITALAGPSLAAQMAVTGLLAAVFSALMNNHPTVYLMAVSIGEMTAAPGVQKFLALAMLIGGDLGPKMLPIGSLAALLWFRILRNHNIQVPYLLYVTIGIPVTLVALLLALAVLIAEVYLTAAIPVS